jgi:hypothetical protein
MATCFGVLKLTSVCRPDDGVYKDAVTYSHVILIFNLYVKNKRLAMCD